MDGYSLAKEQQRPSDTFSAVDVSGDQLANLANFPSGTGGKMRTCLPKATLPYFKIISVINQRLNRNQVRTQINCQVAVFQKGKCITYVCYCFIYNYMSVANCKGIKFTRKIQKGVKVS